jgi:hypothetical protein
MSLIDDLSALGDESNYQKTKVTHPKGFEPGISWDGNSGWVVTEPMAGPPANWTKILEVWNLPTDGSVEIIEPIQMRAWDSQTKDGVQRMFYYKANVRSKLNKAKVSEATKLNIELGMATQDLNPVTVANILTKFSDGKDIDKILNIMPKVGGKDANLIYDNMVEVVAGQRGKVKVKIHYLISGPFNSEDIRNRLYAAGYNNDQPLEDQYIAGPDINVNIQSDVDA